MQFEEVLESLAIPDKPFYRPGEVRRIFGITRLTLSKWLENQVLLSVTIRGQHHITRSSLKELCEQGAS